MFIFELILLIYFLYATGYALTLAIAALFYQQPAFRGKGLHHNIAVFIPAYKEDAVIVDVAKRARQQNYPADRFDVIVIADSLQQFTLQQLRKLDILVIEVAFEKSTKVKALNRAMEELSQPYECALILDADNVMADNFLRDINDLYDQGYYVIQGQRKAKNSHNSMSVLDGISEMINNFIFRQGTVALGGAASLAGSGMMFPYHTLKSTLKNMDSVGGFDRELELKLLDIHLKAYYAKNIIVYDEKIASAKAFQNQRKRWMYSQFYYLKKYFGKGLKQMMLGNIAYLNSAILRNIQLPRLINLGLLTTLALLSLAFPHFFPILSYGWLILWGCFAISMALAIPPGMYNLKMAKSVALLPLVFGKMLLLLFKLKGSNTTFIHTPHTVASVESKKE